MPRTSEDALLDEERDHELNGDRDEEESRKRKREALEDIYRDLTKQKVTSL